MGVGRIRLGVSSHSLYQWVKSIKPDKTEKQAAELIDAKSEILKLRAQLHRTEEERDILKKSRVVLCYAQIIGPECSRFQGKSIARIKVSFKRGYLQTGQ